MRVPRQFEDREIAVIGLGYVGLTLAVALADVGFRVWGVERSRTVLNCLEQGKAHFSERGLDDKLSRQLADGRLTAHATIQKDCRATVFIVTVGTPLGADGRADLTSIREAAAQLAATLKPHNLVILRSTVRVGVTRQVVAPILSETDVPYDLAFCPERTLEGKALEELRSLPQVVGGLTEEAALRATRLFNFLTPTIVRVPDLESAELVKLLNNAQRDLSFAVANEIATMCDVVGVSASHVISACNTGYARSNIALPGPVGGPCLEKDSHILAEALTSLGYRPILTTAGRALNERLPELTVARLHTAFERIAPAAPRKVTILGLAFKGRPETSDLRGTMALAIIAAIRRHFPDAEVHGFDPIVPREAAAALEIRLADSLEEAFGGAELVLIQNNHAVFANMRLESLATSMARPGLIYDYWNLFDAEDLELPHGIRYGGLGNFDVPEVPNGRLAG